MNTKQKYFAAIATIIVVALGGYFIVGGSMNFSPEDAAGSTIDGVKKADKYKSETASAEIDLDGEEVQQLLQNQDFQQLIQNEGLSEVINTSEFAMLAQNKSIMDIIKTSPIELTVSAEKMRKSKKPGIVEFTRNKRFIKLASNRKFQELIKNNHFNTLVKTNPAFESILRSNKRFSAVRLRAIR